MFWLQIFVILIIFPSCFNQLDDFQSHMLTGDLAVTFRLFRRGKVVQNVYTILGDKLSLREAAAECKSADSLDRCVFTASAHLHNALIIFYYGEGQNTGENHIFFRLEPENTRIVYPKELKLVGNRIKISSDAEIVLGKISSTIKVDDVEDDEDEQGLEEKTDFVKVITEAHNRTMNNTMTAAINAVGLFAESLRETLNPKLDAIVKNLEKSNTKKVESPPVKLPPVPEKEKRPWRADKDPAKNQPKPHVLQPPVIKRPVKQVKKEAPQYQPKTVAEKIGHGIGRAVGGVIKGAGHIAGGIIQGVGHVAGGVIEGAGHVVKHVGRGVATVAKGIGQGVKSVWKGLWG